MIFMGVELREDLNPRTSKMINRRYRHDRSSFIILEFLETLPSFPVFTSYSCFTNKDVCMKR